MTQKCTATKVIAKVNHIKQTTYYTCGPTSADFVKENEKSAQKEIKATRKDGATAGQIARFLRKRGLSANISKNSTLEMLCESIKNKKPVLVNYQKQDDDQKLSWKDGHWAVLIGFTKNYLIIADPSGHRRTKISKKAFLNRWYDVNGSKKFYRLAVFIGFSNKKKELGKW